MNRTEQNRRAEAYRQTNATCILLMYHNGQLTTRRAHELEALNASMPRVCMAEIANHIGGSIVLANVG